MTAFLSLGVPPGAPAVSELLAEPALDKIIIIIDD